jgi:hypothetical protein
MCVCVCCYNCCHSNVLRYFGLCDIFVVQHYSILILYASLMNVLIKHILPTTTITSEFPVILDGQIVVS